MLQFEGEMTIKSPLEKQMKMMTVSGEKWRWYAIEQHNTIISDNKWLFISSVTLFLFWKGCDIFQHTCEIDIETDT